MARPLKDCERQNLIKTAQKAGFNEWGLEYLLVLLNVPLRTMDFHTYCDVLPYVNAINAQKFNKIAKEY